MSTKERKINAFIALMKNTHLKGRIDELARTIIRNEVNIFNRVNHTNLVFVEDGLYFREAECQL